MPATYRRERLRGARHATQRTVTAEPLLRCTIPGRCVGKPDADNAAGIPMDALVKAGVLRDDTQVVELRVRRRYVPLLPDGRMGAAEGVVLTLTPWSPA